MCGIFAIINNTYYDQNTIKESFMKGKNRGPESSHLITVDNLTFGFHRLAINGLNEASNQPFFIDDVYLICNGEIYNYIELYKIIGVQNHTDSDCEIIIHLYRKYGIEQTLLMLDGVFSFVLYDIRNKYYYIARDPLGIRPLFICRNLFYAFISSDLKSLKHFIELGVPVEQFKPGHYIKSDILEPSTKHSKLFNSKYIPYHKLNFPYKTINSYSDEINNYMYLIQQQLIHSVNKRCLTTERPIACLLSGGLDSSLIAALVNNFKQTPIETYSIGLEGSEDVRYAEIVAKYIGSKHTSVIITEDDMFNAIPEVIYSIESYDTTTVRASIGNYLISKYISQHSDAKVIFNGDGSDELFGGYLYMHKCPDDIEFDKETRRLLSDICYFDVLRSDKSISSNGLEPRTPFLDRNFVNTVLSVPIYYRNHNNFNKQEKYLLRDSFSPNMFTDYLKKPILPNEVLYRRKEAFSDGVTCKTRSLFQIIQEKIGLLKNKPPSIELEKNYYKNIFIKYFGEQSLSTIPYYWMPKYTVSNDPSARTLTIYEK